MSKRIPPGEGPMPVSDEGLHSLSADGLVEAADHNVSPRDRGLPRRDFLRLAGMGTGAVLAGGVVLPDVASASGAIVAGVPDPKAGRRARARATASVVVVGAGVWGAWTSYHLRQQGAAVTLVDPYGPANSRATSGDETRGIRSSYGDRTTGELWTKWAREGMARWREFDAEHAARFGTRFFVQTGDVIFRDEEEPFTTRTQEHWTKLGVPFEVVSSDDARKRWPMITRPDAKVILYEPDAGVARARHSVQALVALAKDAGVTFVQGRVRPGAIATGRMTGVTLADGTPLEADAFVFACGAWLRTLFPALLGDKMRTPLGHVCYFGTPTGDSRFTYPNMPSWNVPGVTGWPSLPVDNRGFRVRGSFAPPAPAEPVEEPDEPPPPPTPPDPAQQDPELSTRWSPESRIEGSRRVLQACFPALADAPLLETRSCHYEISVNRNFIIDRIPGAANAWIAGVGQAEGFKFAPVAGEYVAWRVLGDGGDPELAATFRLPTESYDTTTTASRRGEDS